MTNISDTMGEAWMSDHQPAAGRTGWWLSWYHEKRFREFELHTPWWISGERMSDGAATIVAVVMATGPEDAQRQVLAAYDDAPSGVEWRFCHELPEDKVADPFTGRFPRQDWMVWPPEDPEDACVPATTHPRAKAAGREPVEVEQGQDVDLEHLPPLPPKWSAPLTEQRPSPFTPEYLDLRQKMLDRQDRERAELARRHMQESDELTLAHLGRPREDS
jgi:hypothetical protein